MRVIVFMINYVILNIDSFLAVTPSRSQRHAIDPPGLHVNPGRFFNRQATHV